MPDLSGITALDVAIGLFFVYLILSIVVSTINEAIASRLKWRSNHLLGGVRNLLQDDGQYEAFLANWRIKALHDDKGRPPSYIPSRAFALALLDTLAPQPGVEKSQDLIAHAKQAVDKIENDAVRGLLTDALAESRGDVERFRQSIERSFDDVMARVSGWYKRRVQVAMFLIGIAVTGFANADTFAIGDRLWRDDAVRAAVVTQATVAAEQDQPITCPAAKDEDAQEPEPESEAAKRTPDPLKEAARCVDDLGELGIPLGWTADTTPDDAWGWVGKVLGLLLTAVALSFGAPFWFDLLGKISRLRGAGIREAPAAPPDPPPERTGEENPASGSGSGRGGGAPGSPA